MSDGTGKALTIRERMKTTAMPVQYEDACRALVACTTIDEAKYFSDKATALAAWAKIFKSDQAALEAKRLKLHAYRRMSQLADEIRPRYQIKPIDGKIGGYGRNRGNSPGPLSLLEESGFTTTQATTIRNVGRLTSSAFDEVISRPKPPSAYQLHKEKLNGSSAWRAFASGSALTFRSYCRRFPAKDLGRQMTIDEADKARVVLLEITDWIDELHQYMPKAKNK